MTANADNDPSNNVSKDLLENVLYGPDPESAVDALLDTLGTLQADIPDMDRHPLTLDRPSPLPAFRIGNLFPAPAPKIKIRREDKTAKNKATSTPVPNHQANRPKTPISPKAETQKESPIPETSDRTKRDATKEESIRIPTFGTPVPKPKPKPEITARETLPNVKVGKPIQAKPITIEKESPTIPVPDLGPDIKQDKSAEETPKARPEKKTPEKIDPKNAKTDKKKTGQRKKLEDAESRRKAREKKISDLYDQDKGTISSEAV